MAKSLLPKDKGCYIGPLGLHTYNAERTECIWCGPNILARKPGKWVPMEEDGLKFTAWSVDLEKVG